MPEAFESTSPSPSLEGRSGLIRNWIRTHLGIDKAIAFTIFARGWSSLAGLMTVALIARFLSPAEQGYYYTFGSLIALQIVFELGFSFVILQMASHERAHLAIASDGQISGDPAAHARLASVLQRTVRWYSSAAGVLAVFLLFAGAHFFSAHQSAGQAIHWRLAWYADAIAATLTFQLDPILSFMEGCGFVAKVARLRLAQAITGSLMAWLALAMHHGLFAPAMTIAGYALVAFIWLFSRRRLLLHLLRYNAGQHRIHWMKEVWPFQWRIAISWLCGYFIYQLYNPVLFAFKGAVEAGQMGMSLSLSTALTAVAVSWINTKAAPFGAMIARREYTQLDHAFFRALKQSFLVCMAGAVSVLCIVGYLNWIRNPFAHRVLSPMALAVLLLNTAMNVVISGMAMYLRAHKQEKYLLNSIVGATFIAGLTYFLGKSYGALGMVSGSLTFGLVVGFPWAVFTFMKYRRLWHAQ
jgi:hypothetical protein